MFRDELLPKVLFVWRRVPNKWRWIGKWWWSCCVMHRTDNNSIKYDSNTPQTTCWHCRFWNEWCILLNRKDECGVESCYLLHVYVQPSTAMSVIKTNRVLLLRPGAVWECEHWVSTARQKMFNPVAWVALLSLAGDPDGWKFCISIPCTALVLWL